MCRAAVPVLGRGPVRQGRALDPAPAAVDAARPAAGGQRACAGDRRRLRGLPGQLCEALLDEADALLERRSGDPDCPRILEAFNQPCDHWLSFFAFTMFTDRDGKYQLAALAESGFASGYAT